MSRARASASVPVRDVRSGDRASPMRRRRPRSLWTLLAVGFVAMAACGEGEGLGAALGSILSISGVYTGGSGLSLTLALAPATSVPRLFWFLSNDDGKPEGTFVGEEVANGDVFPLAGSWAQGRVQFTVRGITYEATFETDNPTQLEFSSPTETLRLSKVPPSVTGTIQGSVTADEVSLPGVGISLESSDGGFSISLSTDEQGFYAFAGVPAGRYIVSLNTSDPDASGVTFPVSQVEAFVVVQGEVLSVDFAGAFIRTSAVVGTVTVSGQPLSGVTVNLSGLATLSTATDAAGRFAFSNLRAGTYRVTMTPPASTSFPDTTVVFALGVGETWVVNFQGVNVIGKVGASGTPATSPPESEARSTVRPLPGYPQEAEGPRDSISSCSREGPPRDHVGSVAVPGTPRRNSGAGPPTWNVSVSAPGSRPPAPPACAGSRGESPIGGA